MKYLSINEAESLAGQFRYNAGLSLTEPVNAKTLIRKLGITAVYRPLSESSYGIGCKSASGKKFILINSNSTRGRQHFTIAHELYHLFFEEHPVPHMCGQVSFTEEKNANKFASALLMPREGLLSMITPDEIANHNIHIATILRMEQYFGVSRNTLLIRLKDVGLISQQRKIELEGVPVKESALSYGYDLSLYEKGNEGVVIGDFGEKARRLFESEKISEGHYVELLNMISDGRTDN